MAVSGVARRWRDPLRLLAGVVLYVLGSIVTLVVLQAADTLITEQYGVPLSIWLWPVSSGLIIVVLYPIFGKPVADHYFQQDTLFRRLERQFWWSLLFFPVLCVVIEFLIAVGLRLVFVPSEARITLIGFGAILVILNSLSGIVVGVPLALGLTWVAESVNELPYYSR